MAQGARRDIIKIIASHSRPWLIEGRKGGRATWSLPPYHEVEKAAEAILEGLEKAGYEIRRVNESCA